jgi:hypothetical protein
MAKFQTWYAEHEAKMASTNDTHKKAQAAKKVYVPVVKKVAEVVEAPVEEAAPVAEAPEAPAAEATETPAE